jgi:hypothetical protein
MIFHIGDTRPERLAHIVGLVLELTKRNSYKPMFTLWGQHGTGVKAYCYAAVAK